jgi:hypothetical protein
MVKEKIIMPARIRKRYDGTESNILINGQFYTYNEIAEAAGVTYKTITNRIGKKPFITDSDLVPVNEAKRRDYSARKKKTSAFEDRCETMMNKWLRKPL